MGPGMNHTNFTIENLNELRQAYLFADADDAQLARLSRSIQGLRLQHGEMLFHHGQPAERFFSCAPDR